MADKVRAVHYVNQFFGGLGAEEAATAPPEVREGSVGPGRALAAALGERGEVVATIICGDNFFSERADEVARQVMALAKPYQPQLIVAGPAFQAGRYGIACGRVCQAAEEDLGIPAVTAMHVENPGVELYRKRAWILEAPATAAGMAEAMKRLVALGLRLVAGEEIGPAADEGYFPRGFRKNHFLEKCAAERAVLMAIAKARGEPFRTELELPNYDRVPPPAPVRDLRHATVALVTEAGIVPKGNPGRLEVGWATFWQKYSIAGLDDLTRETHEGIHVGYDTRHCNQDPDRLLPVDVLRDLEREEKIGRLLDTFYSVSGTGTMIENARRMGREMAGELKAEGVDAVVLTAT